MGRTISIGAQSFEFIRNNNYFVIDKTDFIKVWWENGDTVTLITRPRRFGKTLNLDMMNCFFSGTYKGRGELFEGLSIWEDKAPDGDYKYRKLQRRPMYMGTGRNWLGLSDVCSTPPLRPIQVWSGRL